MSYIDVKSGDIELLTEYDELDESKAGICSVNVFDDNKMVFADLEGIFLSDYSLDNAVPVYIWGDHGVSVSFVNNIVVDSEGMISVLMENEQGSNFIMPAPKSER